VFYKLKDLKVKSIRLILEYQSSSGAYIASPNFPTYHYSWLRDGSFIAYSMLVSGEIDSCRKFLNWVDGTILLYQHKVEKIALKLENNHTLHAKDFLPARYTLDGMEVHDSWPVFQIDGYGTWLWCLAEYSRLTGDERLLLKFKKSIQITINYLRMVWKLPNYDCWEENGKQIHPSTLACVYGGIEGINRFLGENELFDLSQDIRKFILANLTKDNRFPKYIGSESIDSSLLWLSVPFKVVEPEHPVMQRTVQAIEDKLLEKGGVKRYPEDTYYGGGRWILLTCWLAWYYLKSGKNQKAGQLYEWIEMQSDARGYLPEQVRTGTNNSDFLGEWEKRWGKIANPLLWSHAMYLVLVRNLECLQSKG
jgi:GH15 family glucan-1,4-alpha-glucosidase